MSTEEIEYVLHVYLMSFSVYWISDMPKLDASH